MRQTSALAVTSVLSSLLVVAMGSAAAAAGTDPSAGISPFYKLSVVAKSGDQPGITKIGTGVSVNDRGKVAFAAAIPGGEGVLVADGSALTNVASAFLSSTRMFREAVQITDDELGNDRVVARVRKQGVPVTYQLYQFNADATFTLIASGGPNFSPVDVIGTHPSMNDAGRVVAGFQCVAACPTAEGLLVPKVEGSQQFSDYHSLALPSPLRPVMADDGRVVVRDGSTQAIRLLAPDLDPFAPDSKVIACLPGGSCVHPEFLDVGGAPAVDDTGTAVVFTGDRGNGPGVFVSIDLGNGSRELVPVTGERWTGTECRSSNTVNPVGFLGFAADGGRLCFSAVDLNARVAVARDARGGPGIDDDRFVVAFVATPSGPGRDNPALPGIPFLFSGAKGLFTADVDVRTKLQSPTVRAFVPGGPRKVVQLGDIIAGRTISAITLHDSLTIPSTDDTGAPRTPAPGDHRLAFHVATSAGDMVLRASYFDTDEDGLLDHWEAETGGVDVDGDGAVELNLFAMGARSGQKDLFLEIDWLADRNSDLNSVPYLHEPAPRSGNAQGSRGTTGQLAAMFAAQGIHLHVDAGPGADRMGVAFSVDVGTGPLRGGDRITMPGNPGAAPDIVYYAPPTVSPTQIPGVDLMSMDAIKSSYFGDTDKWARELVFHYAALADFVTYADSTGGATLTDPLSDQIIIADNSAGTDNGRTFRSALVLATKLIPNVPGTPNPYDLQGQIVKITSGRGIGQLREISSNSDSTLFLTRRWSVVPDGTSSFVLLNSASGLGEVADLPEADNSLPGNDFVVTLGGWPAGGQRIDTFLQWRTLAHELGHNMSLRHCGANPDEAACGQAPTYGSLMNYYHQDRRDSNVHSYSNDPTTFDDWAHLRFDFQNSTHFLGNSFLADFGAQPIPVDELTLADYYATNPGLDRVPPAATIITPAPGTSVGIGGSLAVAAQASDDVALDSTLFAFDVDGNGDLDGPNEIVTGIERQPGVFDAVFANVSGPIGIRTIHVYPIDTVGNAGTTSLNAAVKGSASLAYTGPSSGVRGQTVTLRATLADAQAGGPVPDTTITFRLGSLQTSGVTDSAGEAHAELTLDLEPNTYQLIVSSAEDGRYMPAMAGVPFEVRWEHTFVDSDGAGTLHLNPSTKEFRFAASGDTSGIKQDPGMRVDTLPAGQRVATVLFTDSEITMTGQFYLDTGAFAAAVRTTRNAYTLHRT